MRQEPTYTVLDTNGLRKLANVLDAMNEAAGNEGSPLMGGSVEIIDPDEEQGGGVAFRSFENVARVRLFTDDDTQIDW